MAWKKWNLSNIRRDIKKEKKKKISLRDEMLVVDREQDGVDIFFSLSLWAAAPCAFSLQYYFLFSYPVWLYFNRTTVANLNVTHVFVIL